MSKDIELFKFIRLYLGEENWDFLKKTSESELALFKKYPMDLTKSYIIFGSENLLNKFRAFYLTRCIKTRPIYSQYSMHRYAEELSSDTKDEYGLNVDQDLIFLYLHQYNIPSFGNAEKWLMETTLNKVADRNRDGLITIILSEVKAPMLSSSGELKVINLSKTVAAATQREAAEKVIEEKGTQPTSSNIIYD